MWTEAKKLGTSFLPGCSNTILFVGDVNPCGWPLSCKFKWWNRTKSQIAGQNEIRRDFTNSIAALHMAAQSVYKGICFHWWNKMYMSPPFSTEIWCQVVVCRIRKAFVLSKQGLPHCPLASTLLPSLHHSLIAANLATFIYTIVLTSKPL